MRKFYFLVVCFVLQSAISALPDTYRIRETNRNYEPGDWTTWASTRFVRHVSIGEQYIYFSTTGGITCYDFYNDKWDSPLTMSNGLADQNIFLTAFDRSTSYLWCIRETGISHMEPASKYWYNNFYDEMMLETDERAVGIGFGSGNVYLVTNLNHIYYSSSISMFFSLYDNGGNLDMLTEQFSIEWQFLDNNKRKKLQYMFMDAGYFFNENNLTIKDVDLRQYNITSWVYDSWNNLWLATWGLGAAKGDTYTQRLNLLPYGLYDDAVDVIAPEKGSLWLAGIQDTDRPSGVTLWDPESWAATYYESWLNTGFDSDRITSCAIDNDVVWFGTQDGLLRYDRDRGSWRMLTEVDNLVDNYVYDVAVGNNRIWAATDRGVSFLNKDHLGGYARKLVHLNYPALRNMAVYDIELQENLVWLGTEYGIYVHDVIADSGGFYTGGIGPEDRTTFAVSVYGNQVWFGTEEGVAAFDFQKKEWLPAPARMYKTHANIHRILADAKAVWVATDEGVLKYDRERAYWVRFTVEDGLPSDLVLSLYLDGDYIWFGTDKGLTRFYWNSPYRID